MRKIERNHKSRKAAAQYLTERGWAHTSTSFGDWVFTAPSKSFKNIIVQLKNRSWEIQAWG